MTPPTTATIPAAGATADHRRGPDPVQRHDRARHDHLLTVADGTGYTVGLPGHGATTITNTNVPTLSISGGTTVARGGAATLTVTADQAPLQSPRSSSSVAGSA